MTDFVLPAKGICHVSSKAHDSVCFDGFAAPVSSATFDLSADSDLLDGPTARKERSRSASVPIYATSRFTRAHSGNSNNYPAAFSWSTFNCSGYERNEPSMEPSNSIGMAPPVLGNIQVDECSYAAQDGESSYETQMRYRSSSRVSLATSFPYLRDMTLSCRCKHLMSSLPCRVPMYLPFWVRQ
jgi:hypothetical protein